MDPIKIPIILLLVAFARQSTSITHPEGMFKDTELIRKRRSEHSVSRKAYSEPISTSKYPLPYIDQSVNSLVYSQNVEGLIPPAYKFFTIKEGKPFVKVSENPQPKYSFVYTEPQQTPLVKEYKYVTLPETIPVESHTGHKDPHEEEGWASKYKFGYRVSDPHKGADYGHTEVSEGHLKKGHYHVLLPDGRLQNVKYWADPSGYHATVTYEGQAHHPQPQPHSHY